MPDLKRLREYVDTLDRTDRMVVTLLYGYKLTHAETADVLNLAEWEICNRQLKIITDARAALEKADAGNR